MMSSAAPIETKGHCASCRWWGKNERAHEISDYGNCLRSSCLKNAPISGGEGTENPQHGDPKHCGVFPQMKHEDRCGDWELCGWIKVWDSYNGPTQTIEGQEL